MADIESGGGGKHKGGKPKGKKLSTRVDFTPMVDLGFLLITFFMLTTSMNKPKTMEITFPADKKEQTEDIKIAESQAMTILLGDDNQIFYYFGFGEGPDGLKMETTNYSKNGIRKILLEESRKRNPRVDSIPILKEQFKKSEIDSATYKTRVRDIKAEKKALIVLIKATDSSTYKNMIDMIDEMNITNIGNYSIVNIDETEMKIISEAKKEEE